MLKRFSYTSDTQDASATKAVINSIELTLSTVLTVPLDSECAIVTIDVQNMDQTANIIVGVTRNLVRISTMLYSLTEWNNIVLDSKEFLEGGDSLVLGSDVDGVMFSVSCDISKSEQVDEDEVVQSQE